MLVADGHDVVGVTMKLWGGESDTGCCSASDVDDARRAAAQIGIEHHVFNFGDQFEQFVVEPYVADHAAGRTPNPCVECNRHLKFDVLLRRAELLGFDAVATGHHARVVTRSDRTRRIARGADPAKDQSYVLHPLTSVELERVLLPIGGMTKDQVRRGGRLARTANRGETRQPGRVLHHPVRRTPRLPGASDRAAPGPGGRRVGRRGRPYRCASNW